MPRVGGRKGRRDEASPDDVDVESGSGDFRFNGRNRQHDSLGGSIPDAIVSETPRATSEEPVRMSWGQRLGEETE